MNAIYCDNPNAYIIVTQCTFSEYLIDTTENNDQSIIYLNSYGFSAEECSFEFPNNNQGVNLNHV